MLARQPTHLNATANLTGRITFATTPLICYWYCQVTYRVTNGGVARAKVILLDPSPLAGQCSALGAFLVPLSRLHSPSCLVHVCICLIAEHVYQRVFKNRCECGPGRDRQPVSSTQTLPAQYSCNWDVGDTRLRLQHANSRCFMWHRLQLP